jgi:DNA-directed RNA polymerase specialized sigma24 family protein
MTAPRRDRELHHFMLLSESEQRAAIVRLAKSGMNPHSIAAACGIAVAQIHMILSQRAPCEGCDE